MSSFWTHFEIVTFFEFGPEQVFDQLNQSPWYRVVDEENQGGPRLSRDW